MKESWASKVKCFFSPDYLQDYRPRIRLLWKDFLSVQKMLLGN